MYNDYKVSEIQWIWVSMVVNFTSLSHPRGRMPVFFCVKKKNVAVEVYEISAPCRIADPLAKGVAAKWRVGIVNNLSPCCKVIWIPIQTIFILAQKTSVNLCWLASLDLDQDSKEEGKLVSRHGRGNSNR